MGFKGCIHTPPLFFRDCGTHHIYNLKLANFVLVMLNTHNYSKFCWHDLCTFPAKSILAETFLCRPKMVRNISHPLQLFNLSWFHWWYICKAALKYMCIAMVVNFQYFVIFHTTKHWYLMKNCIKTIWQYFWGRFARQRLRRWEFPVDWGWWPSNGPPTESVTPHPWKGGFLELTCIDMRDGSFKTPFLLHSQGKV